MWLSIGIDYQYQSIDKLVSIGCRLTKRDSTHTHKKHNFVRSNYKHIFTSMPRPQDFFFDKLKVYSMGQSIDFKNGKWMHRAFTENFQVTEVVLLQTMKLPTTAA